jgi:ethanolamine-phosphate cytidylyltransferase
MNVLSCKYVDEVVIGAPWVMTQDLITTLNLHVVASGTNTKFDQEFEAAVGTPSSANDAYAVPKKLGIFKEIETTHSLNTDDVVNRLIENRLKYENRSVRPESSAWRMKGSWNLADCSLS